MKLSLIKFRVALLTAILILFLSTVSNRFVLAKTTSTLNHNFTSQNLPAENVTVTNFAGIAKSVYQKVNIERKKRGLKTLRWHEKLSDLALDYSQEMADGDFFSHYDEEGNTVVERAEDFGIINWKKIGENLFVSQGYKKSSTIAVKGWLKSPTHRENMLDKDWTHTGIGVYTSRDRKTYITQLFIKK